MHKEDYVFYQGGKFQVEFYFTENGKLPAKEYYDSSNRQAQVKLFALVKYIAEHGHLFDNTKFRLVDRKEKIFEFKPLAERFFNFFTDGKKIIITNAYQKKRDKINPRELERAVTLKRDYQYRLKGGTYYETKEN